MEGHWLRNGVEIQFQSEKRFSYTTIKRLHRLTISESYRSDAGEYTFLAGRNRSIMNLHIRRTSPASSGLPSQSLNSSWVSCCGPTGSRAETDPCVVLLCSVPEPPQVVRHLQPQTATSGRSVRFMVLASGVPPPQVSWYKDSEALFSGPKHKFLHDEQEHTLLLLDASPEDAGVYSCQAQNEYGEDTSSALLTVEGTKPKGVCVYLVKRCGC